MPPPPRRRRTRRAGVGRTATATALVLASLGLGACGDDGTPSADPVPPTSIVPPGTPPGADAPGPDDTTSPTLATAPNPVRIVGSRFEPRRIEVAVGDTVTWINDDTIEHWVVTPGRDAIDSATLTPGNSYAETFDEPGTYTYTCNIHDGMSGSVVVR